MGEGSSKRGRQTMDVNSVVQEGSSKRGRQTVDVNSVVQEGSSNSVSEQWSSNSGRPKGVVKQCQ